MGKVVSPVLSQHFLASDVPDVEFEFVVGEVFDVETLGWRDGGDVLCV